MRNDLKEKIIIFRVSNAENERLREYSKMEKLSISGFIRLAIDELIKNRRIDKHNENV